MDTAAVPGKSTHTQAIGMTALLVVFLAVLCLQPLAGQVQDTIPAYQKLREAIKLNDGRKYTEALKRFQEAADLYLRVLDSNDIRIAELNAYQSGLYRILGQPEQQYRINARSLEILSANDARTSQLAANAHNSLGIAASNLGQYDEAAYHYKKAIQVSRLLGDDAPDLAPIFGNLGILARRTGDHDNALAYLSKAMGTYQQERDLVGKARTHINLGNVYFGLFENEKAFYHYRQAIVHEDTLVKSNPMIPIAGYQGIAKYYKDRLEYAYALLNYEKAKSYLLSGLGINHPYYFRNERLISQVYHQMGWNRDAIDVILDDIERQGTEVQNSYAFEILCQNYRALDSLEKAREYAERAKELIALRKGIDAEDYVYPMMENVMNLMQENRYEEAEPILSECLGRMNGFLPPAHPRIARAETYLAEIFSKTGRHDEAMAMCDRALVKLGHHPDSVFSFAQSSQLRNWEFSHRMKTRILYQRFQQMPSVRHASDALHIHQAHLAYLTRIQSSLVENASKLQLLDNRHAVAERTIALLLYLHDADPGKGYLAKAFWVADRSKDNLLAELSIKKRMRETESRTLRFGKKESALLAGIADLQLEVFRLQQAGAPEADILKARNGILEKRKEIMSLDAAVDEPEQVTAPGLLSVPASGLKDLLPAQTACIEFFEGEDDTYILIGTRHGYFDGGKVSSDQLRGLLTRYKAGLLDLRSDAWKTDGFALFTVLLQPALSSLDTSVRHLLVIPDGGIASVALEALSMDGTPQSLVIDRFQVSYSPSLSVLEGQQQHAGRSAPGRLAAFAPVYEEMVVRETDSISAPQFTSLVRSGNYHLPGALEEAREIRKIAGGKLFAGPRANEGTFKEVAGDYRILHLSMHAILENENPAFSRLVFSPGGNEDGSLFTNELTSLDLDADLAVLSACNTGSGLVQRGEGVMSLARSFHYSGTRATTHSLWKVPDEATKQVMVAFYRNLAEGMDKASALHEAKLAYRSGQIVPERTHPYYWAGFVLHGNWQPVSLQSQDLSWPYILLISLVLAAGIILLVRNKRGRKS